MSNPLALPLPRTESPMSAPSLRWGIMGPGRIAEQYAESLQRHTQQRVTAVASRNVERAADFAARFGIGETHGSYASLAASPEVDIVYVATPHVFHRDCALAAIAGGKHVLVEKPVSVDAPSARDIARAASAAGVFVMEAMWPRFTPAADVMRQLLANGTMGPIRFLRADLGEYFEPDPSARLFDPALGGGSLLDLGVYLGAFDAFVFGGDERAERAELVDVRGTRTATGVSADVAMTVAHPTGTAQLYTSLHARTPTEAFIQGEAATLRVDAPFYAPTRLTLTTADGTQTAAETYEVQDQIAGLCYEAAEAARAVHAGLGTSPLYPIDESIAILEVLDQAEARLS